MSRPTAPGFHRATLYRAGVGPAGGATVGPDFPMSFRRESTGLHDANDFAYAWGDPLDVTGVITFGNVLANSFNQAGGDKLFAISQLIGRDVTIAEVAIVGRTATTASADNSIRLGLFADTGACYPGALIWQTELTVFGSSNVGPQVAFGACGQRLLAGRRYWMAWCHKTALITNTVSVQGFSSNGLYPVVGMRFSPNNIASGIASNAAGVPAIYGWSHAHVYGALPATFPTASPVALPQQSTRDTLGIWCGITY